MTNRDNDELLGAYIQRLHELETDDTPALDATGLADVARQMGVDDALLGKADVTAQDALQRGKGLLAARRYGEAIENLALAVDLRPFDIAPVREMGRALLMRGRATGVKKDTESARTYLDRALGLAPDDEATWHLLDELDGRVAPPASKRRQVVEPATTERSEGTPKQSAVIMIIVGVLAALGIAFGVGLSQRSVERPPDRDVQTAPAKPTVAKPKAHVIPRPAPTSRKVPSRALRRWEKEVPVELVPDKRLAGMKVVNVRSTFTAGRSNWYRGSFELEWNGTTELARVELQGEGLDAAGKRVAVKTLHAVRKYGAPARPGDRLPQAMLFRASRPVVKIRIRPLVVFTQPAAKTYPEGEKVPVVWEVEKPAGIDIDARLRSEQLRKHGTAKSFHKATVMVRNLGERALSHLKVQYRYTGKDGQVLDAVDRYVVMTTAPTLLPGKARSTHVVRILSARPRAWTMHVIDAR